MPARRGNRAAPHSIQIAAATGAGPTALAAFDAALRELGVGEANLIRLSSVIPPHTRLESAARIDTPITWGDRLYCVYAAGHADTAGVRAAAGIGWTTREDGAGLFVEHEAETAEEVEHLVRTSLADMARHRTGRFGPVRLRTSETRCDDRPACAVVLAAFGASGWADYEPAARHGRNHDRPRAGRPVPPPLRAGLRSAADQGRGQAGAASGGVPRRDARSAGPETYRAYRHRRTRGPDHLDQAFRDGAVDQPRIFRCAIP
ncbi:pyruvoyl-dependent arginine decarboxylase [Nocardia cyriacigeorgica]|nr:pyruvoyl-dependent arginine decarboxylase [Nocardia cyriacigeorgica]